MHPSDDKWEDQSGRILFIVDTQSLQQMVLGLASLRQEGARPLLNRISNKLFALVRSGMDPPRSWVDPVEWRPREYNKRADYLCNQSLDTAGSHEYVDPDFALYANLRPN